MQNLIENGGIVDIMLLVIALEIVILLGYRLATGRGLPAVAVLLNIGAGGSLMVALKLKFAQVAWYWLALALVSALVFHVADMVFRWRNNMAKTTA